MSEDTATRIVELLETAPGWCRVGLTAPTARLRGEAIQALAACIAAGLAPLLAGSDDRQLALPLREAGRNSLGYDPVR